MGYLAATPDYALVHDALDYDRSAKSIAQGDGYPDSRRPGRETAFRPPAYPVLLAGAYKLAGVEGASKHDRVVAGRILGILISTLIVGLIGVVAAQLWGRRVALAAMGLAAVYIPLILVGGSVMSEPLFAALLLGALAAAIQHRRSTHRWRWVLLAGVLGGLTTLTRGEMSEPEVEDILRARSKAYIREHPTYVAKVALWTTLRVDGPGAALPERGLPRR